MIPRSLPKLGLWLFVLAVVWYFVGNSLLKQQKKELSSHEIDLHKSGQQFVVGSGDRLVIRKPDANFVARNIKLIFDPDISQVTVNNQSLGMSVRGDAADGVINITLERGVTPGDYSHNEVQILLPASVNKLEFSGVNSLDISGRLPTSTTELSLEMTDCVPQVNLQQLSVKRLKLVSTCQELKKDKCCTGSFNLGEQVQIGKLEVNMLYGSLDFSSEIKPQETLLMIGEEVVITGRRAFFETARFQGGAR